MPDVEQVPGRLNITVTQGDAFSIDLTFDVSISGWNWDADVVHSAGTQAITITPGSGKITLSLTSGQTGVLPLGVANWYLDRVDTAEERRYVAGTFNVVQYYV